MHLLWYLFPIRGVHIAEKGYFAFILEMNIKHVLTSYSINSLSSMMILKLLGTYFKI